MAALSPAERQRNKRTRDARKLKTFHEFMQGIGEFQTIEAGKVITDISEKLHVEPFEINALFIECFNFETISNSRLCEEIVRFKNDRRLQQHWWKFLRELERFQDAHIIKIIDKRIKEFQSANHN